jgi:hypothetical protein
VSFTDGVNKAFDNTKQETEIGIGGYRLFAKVDESTKYSNIVPTEVLEDGSNSADDILNNPISISMSGVVGDLIVEAAQFPEIISKDFSIVGEVTALLPSKSQQQIQRVSQIDSQLRDAQLLADRAERLAGNAYGFFNNSASNAKSQQEKFIEYMESIHFSRLPIELSTKYRDYKNMALSDLTITSDNQTNDVRFTASFIQVNYLQLVYVEVSENYSSPSGATSGKTSDEANKGGQNPEENKETSLLGSIFG